jgi:hypothetical protein
MATRSALRIISTKTARSGSSLAIAINAEVSTITYIGNPSEPYRDLFRRMTRFADHDA